MSNNTTTIVKEFEQFSPRNFPDAMNELSVINQGIADIPRYFRVEIIVSYLKDHALRTDWVEANPGLARLMTTGFFKTSQLESLFDFCRNNKTFLDDLEDHISQKLLAGRN
ncbi:hypothetical protein [Longitalea luteola]|uniref:hypothetical protein n=1 Tax=Longitalea luteola TaxID=2812563 RepID=UPI001A96164B|nr:hypothetical protein [Longitalea luteola]